jgi:hypothetical protein
MGEVEAIQELLNADYKQIIIAMAILVVALVVIKKFLNEFIELFNIETPTMKKERERKREIEDIREQLKRMQEKQRELSNQSNESDERMQAQISMINELLKSLTVASMRSTLWRIHSEAIKEEHITPEGLKTFTECGKLYESVGGDDIYHSKLYPEVMALPIRPE